jgi:hypothetical protein
MGAIVIKADSKSNKLLKALVDKIGGQSFTINDEQYEDLLLGTLMDKEKTGNLVSREDVFKALTGDES